MGSQTTWSVHLVTADGAAPVPMTATLVVDTSVRMPIIEYQHAAWSDETPSATTLLCFAGGGCSGAAMAAVADACLPEHARVVSFDMPGHTPPGLLGQQTPQRSLLTHSTAAVRAAVANHMVSRWAARSERLVVLSHSAGFNDISRIARNHVLNIDAFLVCAAPIPGLGAMIGAARASTLGGSAEPVGLATLLLRRLVPTGLPSELCGPIADPERMAALASYQCLEHVSVPMSLLSDRTVRRQDWRGRRVTFIGSLGDRIAPVPRIRQAVQRMDSWGADSRLEVLEDALPHNFLLFKSAARRVAELTANPRGPGRT